MTVIASLLSEDSIIIGYNDGAELSGTPIKGTAVPWLFFGEWALGITGESSVQRLLEKELVSLSENNESNSLINNIASMLLDNNIGSKSETDYVTTFGIYGILVHKSKRIWDVSGCLSLTEIPKGVLWAQGSGADYAMGASYVIAKALPLLGDKDKMLLSIESAIENDINCVGLPIVRDWRV